MAQSYWSNQVVLVSERSRGIGREIAGFMEKYGKISGGVVMKRNLMMRGISVITVLVFMWGQGGVSAFADSRRWEGENKRLQREAVDAKHVLSAKIQEIIESGVYSGKEGKRLYLAHVEQGWNQLLKEQWIQLQKMSEGAIRAQLNRIKEMALRNGNEKILEVLSVLETDDARSLQEKLDALYGQVNKTQTQVLAFVHQQIEAIGHGNVNKMLVFYKTQLNKVDGEENMLILLSPVILPVLAMLFIVKVAVIIAAVPIWLPLLLILGFDGFSWRSLGLV